MTQEASVTQAGAGPAIRLLRASGSRVARAAIAVAVLVGAVEVIQIHLPGRVA